MKNEWKGDRWKIATCPERNSFIQQHSISRWYILEDWLMFLKSTTRLQWVNACRRGPELTKSRTRENSGVLRVFSGSAGFLVSCSSVSGGTCLMKKYLQNRRVGKGWNQSQSGVPQGTQQFHRPFCSAKKNKWCDMMNVMHWRSSV